MTARSGTQRLDPSSRPTIREIVNEHLELIRGSARSVLGNGHEADVDEVVWDTVRHVHEHLDAFDPGRGTLRTWLYRVTKRRATRHVRAARSHAGKLVQEADVEEELANVADDDAPTVEERMETHEWMRLWDDVLPTLPENERTVLVKHVQSGLTAEEIATELDEAVGTIKTRMRRAQKRIEGYLKRRQAVQERRGAAVFPMSASAFLTRIGEASREVSDAQRARLTERLSAYLDGEADRQRQADPTEPPRTAPRPRLYRQRVVASLASSEGSGAAVGNSLAAGLVLALTLLLIVLLMPMLLRLSSPPGRATGATAPPAAPPAVLVATATLSAAPVAVPAAATSGTMAVAVAAPDSMPAAPAPGSAPVRAAGGAASTSAERRAIVTAFNSAVRRHDYAEACRLLGEYNGHGFVGAGAVADRAQMAKAGACQK